MTIGRIQWNPARRMRIDPNTVSYRLSGYSIGYGPSYEVMIVTDALAVYVSIQADEEAANALARAVLNATPGGVDLGRMDGTSMLEYPAASLTDVLAYFTVQP